MPPVSLALIASESSVVSSSWPPGEEGGRERAQTQTPNWFLLWEQERGTTSPNSNLLQFSCIAVSFVFLVFQFFVCSCIFLIFDFSIFKTFFLSFFILFAHLFDFFILILFIFLVFHLLENEYIFTFLQPSA